MTAVATTPITISTAFVNKAMQCLPQDKQTDDVRKHLESIDKTITENHYLARQLSSLCQTVFIIQQQRAGSTDFRHIAHKRDHGLSSAKCALEKIAELTNGNAQLQELIKTRFEDVAKESEASTQIQQDRRDTTEDAPTLRAAATATATTTGSPETAAETTAGKSAPPKPYIKVSNGKITDTLESAPLEAAITVIQTLIDSNREAPNNGSIKADITALFRSATAIPEGAQGKNQSDIATELTQFAERIKGKNIAEVQEIFSKELSPHAQQALSQIADKHLDCIFNGDLIHLCAVAIKSDARLSQIISKESLEAYKAYAQARDTVVNDEKELKRRANLSAKLGDLIHDYKIGMKAVQAIEDTTAKAKHSASINAKFMSGFDALMKKPNLVYKDDLESLQRHLELAKGNPESAAKETESFAKQLMGKLFSKGGATLIMFALSQVAPLIPIFGKYLTGVSNGVITLVQMFNASSQMFGGAESGAANAKN